MKLESKATNKWCFRSNKEELLAIHLLDFLFFAASRNFFLIFIEILLIYNVMLVSNTQKIESVVFFFSDSLFWVIFQIPFHTGYDIISSRAPSAIQQVLISYLSY